MQIIVICTIQRLHKGSKYISMVLLSSTNIILAFHIWYKSVSYII
jgi:hypothetical protein